MDRRAVGEASGITLERVTFLMKMPDLPMEAFAGYPLARTGPLWAIFQSQ